MRSKVLSSIHPKVRRRRGWLSVLPILLFLLLGLTSASCTDGDGEDVTDLDGDTLLDGDGETTDTEGKEEEEQTEDCDDENPCTTDFLGENGCEHLEKDCSRLDSDCAEGVCDPADGSCRQQVYTDTRPCEDGSEATMDDACDNGVCLGVPTCGEGFRVGEYRECAIENQYGSCAGLQLCNGDLSFSDCSGKTPTQEECDGVDNDCDEAIDEPEGLVNRFCPEQRGVCQGAMRSCGGVAGWLVCSDATYLSHNPAYEAAELSCDGLDNDCDGLVDEGCDDDEDGYCDRTMNLSGEPEICPNGGGDCDDTRDRIHPGRTELCDGIDNDCDDILDNPDKLTYPLCFQQQGVCEASVQTCDGARGWQACAVSDYQLHSEHYENLIETLCDGLDNDCDGLTDEGCDDDQDDTCDASMTVIGTPDVCPNGEGDCNDQSATTHPGAVELCDNYDNDCDEQVDELEDLEMVLCPNQNGVCAQSRKSCLHGLWQSCTVQTYQAHSVAYQASGETLCDGMDNDCNDETDEGCDDDLDDYCDVAMTTVGTPPVCPFGGGDCRDDDALVFPDQAEFCDGLDNNCDGLVDDPAHLAYEDCETQEGACLGALKRCEGENGWQDCKYWDYKTYSDHYQLAETACDNQDNDCDGQTDATCIYDADRDGVSLDQGDCNDLDPAVWPDGAAVPFLEIVPDRQGGSASVALWHSEETLALAEYDILVYEILFDGGSSVCKAGLLLENEDRSFSLAQAVPGLTDSNGLSIAPETDLCAVAKGTWVTREILLPADVQDLEISRLSIVVPQTDQVTRVSVRNVVLFNEEGVLALFHGEGEPFTWPDAQEDIAENLLSYEKSLRPPHSTELPDGVDNDCNGTVDEGVRGTCDAPRDVEPFTTVTADLFGQGGSLSASCAPQDDGHATVFRLVSPLEGRLYLSTEGSRIDTVLSVRRFCDSAETEIFCNDDQPDGRYSAGYVDVVQGETLFIRVASAIGQTGGEIRLSTFDAVDYDEDGFVVPFDCDETDPQRHVGAEEACDGKDNDCDGIEDNGCDEDRDEDTVTPRQGDCNDEDSMIAAGMPELCDGKDNDCDGVTDNGCDYDDDGAAIPDDCDDNDDGRTPGAEELCDGKDNDCDGITDNGCDYDDDGVSIPEDCDDNDDERTPGAEELCDGKDNDCDGVVDNGCDYDDDGVSIPEDCDDNDLFVYPGAEELCDGKDNDCDPETPTDNGCDVDEDDVPVPEDCDDSAPLDYPGAFELCDGRDNDCDGLADNGCDYDNDGVPIPQDCDDNDPDRYPGAAEICWDGKDNDCDPATPMDEGCEGSHCFRPIELTVPTAFSLPFIGLSDTTRSAHCAVEAEDGPELRFAFTAAQTQTLVVSTQGSTVDTVLSLRAECQNPESEWVCNDDIHGLTTSGLQWTAARGERYSLIVDSKGFAGGLLSLSVSVLEDKDDDGVFPPLDCNDDDQTVYPGAVELCDGEDHDCNGVDDDGCDLDLDTDNYTPRQGDCDDRNPNRHPGMVEIQHCNGLDNDCDGIVDDGCDEDTDEFPIPSDCDDTNPAIHPGVPEICGNGIDENCNNSADEGCDFDEDDVTVPQDCNDLDPAIHPGRDEICNNGVDDNCNGEIDEGCVGTCHSPLWLTVPGQHFTGDSTLAESRHLGSCYPYPGKENVYAFVAPSTGILLLSTQGSDFDTLLYVREGICEDSTREWVCNDDAPAIKPQSQVRLSVVEGETYFVFVDSVDTPVETGGGNVHLSITLAE